MLADRARNLGQILDLTVFSIKWLDIQYLASRKQDVEQKYRELIYVQALCTCPPGLCKKDAQLKEDIFTVDTLYSV